MKTFETGAPQKIQLTVYYESQCPDSKDFIVNELQPALTLLHNYLILKLIPFGKAKSIDNTYFECQHGPTECTGNMVQSCALHVMKESGANDRKMLDYVVCEMKTEAGTTRNLWCVKKARVNENLVTSCLSSRMGTELLLRNEDLTKLVSPTFIPTITIDGIFDQGVQDSGIQDLIGTLCSYREDMPPCVQHYNLIGTE
ncbi:unnamed protein product [Arctia plantaginis]|uniref:Gamma-interferon-inducible lysosomal thiol reductase n=1 Tax=Arctia plantaginis TaxID=874455 RepID=A0A8S1A792_ARCPL|nr:unnamed protein product [Arctia plantaginis]